MVDILHRIGVASAPADVYAALTTVDGLASWWAADTDGDATVGGVLRFRFDRGGFDMLVLAAQPAELVRWEVVDGPAEWIGTQVRFELKQEDGFTIVCSATKAGASRWSSCTTAAPSGRSSC